MTADDRHGHRRRDLEDTREHPVLGTLSLRWALTHCIRELAQHAGHAKILVEQIRASPRVAKAPGAREAHRLSHTAPSRHHSHPREE